jgi:hypothetical protein
MKVTIKECLRKGRLDHISKVVFQTMLFLVTFFNILAPVILLPTLTAILPED